MRVHGSTRQKQLGTGASAGSTSFEAGLVDAGTTVVKCFLHISYDEQRERFRRRLRRHDKQWKFAASDLDTRRSWDEYQVAYAEVIAATSSTLRRGTWCRPTASGTGTG